MLIREVEHIPNAFHNAIEGSCSFQIVDTHFRAPAPFRLRDEIFGDVDLLRELARREIDGKHALDGEGVLEMESDSEEREGHRQRHTENGAPSGDSQAPISTKPGAMMTRATRAKG